MCVPGFAVALVVGKFSGAVGTFFTLNKNVRMLQNFKFVVKPPRFYIII